MTYLMLLFITVDKEKDNQIFVYNNVLSQDKKDFEVFQIFFLESTKHQLSIRERLPGFLCLAVPCLYNFYLLQVRFHLLNQIL